MGSSKSLTSGHLVVYDALAMPRHTVILKADLLEEHFLRSSGLGGEMLQFQFEGRPIGQAMTGGDGRAVKEFRPTTLGTGTISVRLAESKRVSAADATARLFVWDRRRPLFVVSLSAVMSKTRGLFPPPLSDSGAELPDPDPKAVKMLSKLSGRRGLVYLMTNEPMQLADMRKGIADKNLPEAPLVLLKPGAAALTHELRELAQSGWDVRGGLVSTPEEAKSLVANGKIAMSPPSETSREKWPEKTVKPKDWEDAGTRVLKNE